MQTNLKELISGLKDSFDELPKFTPKDYTTATKKELESKTLSVLKRTNIDIDNTFTTEKLDNLALTMLDKDLTLFEDSSGHLNFLDTLNYATFDLSVLPDVMQGLCYYIKLIPNNDYPNSATLLTATFNAAAVLGQLRPRINDTIYSNDILGLNVYGFAFLRSGSGKDRTQQAILDLFGPAIKTIDNYKYEEARRKGRIAYIRAQKQSDPNFEEPSDLSEEDYKDYIPDILSTLHDTFMESTSTVEGLTVLLNDAEKSSYSTANLFMSEMGMSIRSNQENVSKLFEKFAVLYDMGRASKKVLKTKELREKSINDSYPNVFGISSPAFIFGDHMIKTFFQAYVMGAYGRRAIFIFPTKTEEFENRINVTSTIALNQINDNNARKSNEVKIALSEELDRVVEFVNSNKEIKFDEEAGRLYDYFRTYTKTLASVVKTVDPLNPIGVALEGKAFLTARIAGIWTLLERQSQVTADIMKASIYFTLYTNNHLLRFMKKLNNKPYELIVDSYLQGEIKHKLPVIDAIKAGFISENRLTSQKIKEFLQPVNSLLKNEALVSYSEHENAFLFVPVINIEPEDLSVQYIYGSASQDGEFQETINTQMQLLNIVVKTERLSIFSHTPATNFIVIPIKKSIFSMETLHEYYKNFVHAIGLGENKEDPYTYTIVLPVSTQIKSSAEYRYVCKAISNELFSSSVEPQATEYTFVGNHSSANHHIIHIPSKATLLDIQEEQQNFTTHLPIERKDVFRKLTAKQMVSEEEDLQLEIGNLVEVLDQVDNKWMLLFNHLVKYKLIYKDISYITDVMNNINILINNPIDTLEIQKHLIAPIERINAS